MNSCRLASVVLLAVSLHAQGKVARRPPTLAAAIPSLAATSLLSMSVTPGSISFLATDPDLGAVAGSATARVTFTLDLGSPSRLWTLTVQAGSSTFTGCATLPASAVRATCSSVTVVNTGGSPGTGACSAAFNLSTTPQQIAGGAEGSHTDNYTINITYTLTDSWRYIAAVSPTCPLNLTYVVNAP